MGKGDDRRESFEQHSAPRHVEGIPIPRESTRRGAPPILPSVATGMDLARIAPAVIVTYWCGKTDTLMEKINRCLTARERGKKFYARSDRLLERAAQDDITICCFVWFFDYFRALPSRLLGLLIVARASRERRPVAPGHHL